MASCLKDLPQRLQTPSLNIRKSIFHDLTDMINTCDLPDNIIKGICKVLGVTIMRYQDDQSRTLVLDFIKVMSAKFPAVVCKAIHMTISDNIGAWKNTTATKSLSKPCLAALGWSCVGVSVPDTVAQKEDVKKIIDVQSVMAGIIFTSGAKTLVDKTKKILRSCWEREGILDKLVEGLTSSEHGVHVAVFGAQMMQILADKQQQSAKIKDFLMEMLTKTLLMSKVKLPKESMKKLEPFLKQVSLPEFKEKILPVMNKSLLRSPEISLSLVSVILRCLNLDLSCFSTDLAKTFCTSLKSKDDQTRDDAGEAIVALSERCEDQSAVEKVLDAIFATLAGKDGKISVNTIKMSLLAAAGSLSQAGNNLATPATKLFVKFLQDETHEATVICGLEQLSHWSAHYTTTVPEELITWVTKALSDKNSSSQVKCAVLMCLSTSIHTSTAAATSAGKLAQPLMKVYLCYFILFTKKKLNCYSNFIVDCRSRKTTGHQ